MADHESHDKIYLRVFGALCVFTLLSAIADLFKEASPGVVGVVVLAIAVAKAACVMLFFMHLKWERGWKYVLLAPTTILAIGLPIALMPDIGWNYAKPYAFAATLRDYIAFDRREVQVSQA